MVLLFEPSEEQAEILAFYFWWCRTQTGPSVPPVYLDDGWDGVMMLAGFRGPTVLATELVLNVNISQIGKYTDLNELTVVGQLST